MHVVLKAYKCSYPQGDGNEFLDNCICGHWDDVRHMLELSTVGLPPECTDAVSHDTAAIMCMQ